MRTRRWWRDGIHISSPKRIVGASQMGMPFRLKTEGHSWMDRAKWALSGPPKEAGEAGAGGDGEGGAGEGGVEAREDDKVTGECLWVLCG